MQQCTNCGAAVEGRFCPRCGAQVVAAQQGAPAAGGYAPPMGSAPGQVTAGGIDENLAGALCYIPIIGLIFLLIDPYKRNRTVRFHAWQSLIFVGGFFLLRIALIIIAIVLPGPLRILIGLLAALLSLAYIGGLIFMAVKAYQRSRLVLPFITPLAEKQAG